MENRYFLLGETVPIMVTYSESGHKVGAYVPRSERRELVCKVTYLSRIERSYEVDEIDEAAFAAHCQQFWDKRGVPE
jgi:hypothetical protein